MEDRGRTFANPALDNSRILSDKFIPTTVSEAKKMTYNPQISIRGARSAVLKSAT